MSRITPRLYVGDFETAKNLSFLESNNINTIVNCSRELENIYPNEFNYINLALDDVATQDLSDVLEPIANEIISHIKNKKNVFVHCYAGVSRSTTIIIYTIMKFHKWDFEKSLNFVKKMHPRTNPNPGFIKQLTGGSIDQNVVSTDLRETFDAPDNLYKSDGKKWKNMQFDSPEEDIPEYSKPDKGRRNIYAHIFS